MCIFLGLQHFLTMIGRSLHNISTSSPLPFPGGTLSIPYILCPSLCIRSATSSSTTRRICKDAKYSKFHPREDDPARSYILSTIFFVSGIVTLLQTTLGCRLPIVQVALWDPGDDDDDNSEDNRDDDEWNFHVSDDADDNKDKNDRGNTNPRAAHSPSSPRP